jgi:hypothetical protein
MPEHLRAKIFSITNFGKVDFWCFFQGPDLRFNLPHLAEEGGTPVRRACVPRYLGHTAESNPCRMLVPPVAVLVFKAAELVAEQQQGRPTRERTI